MVYTLYDNFSTGSIFDTTKWTLNPNCSSSTCNITSEQGYLYNSDNPPGGTRGVNMSKNFSDLNCDEVRVKITDVAEGNYNGHIYPASVIIYDGTNTLRLDYSNQTGDDFKAGDTIRLKCLRNGDVKLYVNDILIKTTTGYNWDTTVVNFRVWAPPCKLMFDDVYYKKINTSMSLYWCNI